MEAENNKRLGELIVELANGNVQALGKIADLVEKLLIGVGIAYYRNREDVEDAVQNLYVKLHANAKQFKRNKNACAWIVRIFENSIKSDLKRRRREDLYIQQEISHLSSGANIVDERCVEQHLLAQEILASLSDEEKRILIYYHWCHCTIREVAHILHKPSSTIHKKLMSLEEKVKNF